MHLLSICTGLAAPLETPKGKVMSAFVKTPVAGGRAQVRPLGIEGDEQVDLSVHGGLGKAVYVYPSEHYTLWNTMRRQALRPEGRVIQEGHIPFADIPDLPWGAVGENLTIAGLLENEIWIGDRMRFGEVELVVTEPRQPCYKFAAAMGFKHAPKMMVQAGCCGWYCEVRRTGELAVGESFELIAGDRYVTITEQFALATRKQRAGFGLA
ncbi:MOSC domain-containing protein [Derxia gummosa]|uniref:MOSC domain-containing protein n=1 Tax=Derxia gummosa DSM 723 TaxID=1121388 RepID=A0A8B6X801_9BURK|nr:MOSC domain-containing protein [Derxia gummosa]